MDRYILVISAFQILNVFGQSVNTTDNVVNNVEICSICTCGAVSNRIYDTDIPEIVIYVQCTELDKIGANRIPSLDTIKWPPNEDRLKILAAFEGLGLSNVEWLPYNQYVDSLSFSYNQIETMWPNAFEKLPNLKKLSLSHNKLTEITPDMFSNLKKLEELDLSNNYLTSFNNLDFASLIGLKKINLQNNSLDKVPVRALEKIPTLEDLDVSNNEIYHFEKDSKSLEGLKRLSLNGNKLTVVVKSTFGNNTLEDIDLSNNNIGHVDKDAFAGSKNLKELNVAENLITTVFNLPKSLNIISFRKNRLQIWPRFQRDIRLIDLSYNELVNTDDDDLAELLNLEVLILAGNQLQKFNIFSTLPKLYSLDLSFNLISVVPESISSRIFPSLEELRLDGNPLKDVFFPSEICLKTLHLNQHEQITHVKDFAFSNVKACGANSCVHLYLSSCHLLSELSANSFKMAPLCYLDLSNNNLSAIPPKMLEWNQLKDGINLQGNPWNCVCQMQWMIDDVLPLLYKSHPNLLQDLRCETPRGKNSLRLVHWYNWDERPLCQDGDDWDGDAVTVNRDGTFQVAESKKASVISIFRGNSLMIGLSISIGVIVILILIIVIYLILTRRRSYEIRKAMLAKRQSRIDEMNSDMASKEQFTALNRS